MTHASGRLNRFVRASLALMCGAAVGCHADAVAPKTVPTPSGPMRDLGMVIVDVDVKKGTVSMHPLASTDIAPAEVNARFFGTPVQIEYAITLLTPVSVGPGAVDYPSAIGFSNLLTFAIGTNSPHTAPAFPQDTMGAYVYLALPPHNITNLAGPCDTCVVAIESVDGAYPFTTPAAQPYLFWKTILEGGGTNAQGPGNFETNQSGIGGINYQRHFTFHTAGNVTNFTYGLAMAAAWVEPNDNRWKVFYVADSVPDRVSLFDLRSEPDWRRLGSTGTVTVAPAACAPNTGACQLSLVSAGSDSIIYYRSDSLRASQSGYIAATVTPSGLGSTTPSVFLGLKDPAKLAQLGISNTLTGFTDSTGAFVLPTIATDLSRTSYRVSKVGTDSAAIYSPASALIPILQIPYSALPPAPVRGSGPPNYDRFFFFGNITAATSLWSNVNYEIGAAHP